MTAATKKTPAPKFTSPIGTFKYPALAEPSYGSKEYPKPEGEYQVRLILKQDAKSTQDFMTALMVPYAAAEADALVAFNKLPIAQRKKIGVMKINPLFDLVYDKDTEEPTGDIEFRFKLTASGVYKGDYKKGQDWTARPVLFDGKGRKMDPCPEIWGGSEGRIGFTASPYFINGTGAGGLKLRLTGAQVTKLVERGGYTADSLGFGTVEDGYDYVAPASVDTATDADADASSDQIPF